MVCYTKKHFVNGRNAPVQDRTYVHSSSSREKSEVEPRSVDIDLEGSKGTLSFVSGKHWEEDPSKASSISAQTEATGRARSQRSARRGGSIRSQENRIASNKFREVRIACSVKADGSGGSGGGTELSAISSKAKNAVKPSQTAVMPPRKVGAMKVENLTEQPIIDFLAKTIPDFLLDNPMDRKGLEKMSGDLIGITHDRGKGIATLEGVQKAWAVVEKKYRGGYFDDEPSSKHASDDEIDTRHDGTSDDQS
jgi:hypothetical protein